MPPIYDKPTRLLLADAAAELTPPFSVDDITRWFAERYPKLKRSNVTAHIRFLTANDPNRQHHAYLGGQEPILFRTEDGFVPYDRTAHGEWDTRGRLVGQQPNVLDGFSPPVPFNGDEVRAAPDGPGVHVAFDHEGTAAFVGRSSATRDRLRAHLSGGRGSSVLRRAVGAELDASLERVATNEEISAWIEGCTVSWLATADAQTQGIKGRLVAELEPRLNTLLPPSAARVWWVNQGQSYEFERDAGVIFASSSSGLSHHENVAQLRPGDLVLHYARRQIQAVSVVTRSSVEELRPYEGDSERDVGHSARADYLPLHRPIDLDEISPRTVADGPFDVNGTVKQQYLMPIPPAFAARLAHDFADRWPEGTFDRAAGDEPVTDIDDVTGLIARWRAEKAYPTPRDLKLKADREQMAPHLTPGGLDALAAEPASARSFLNRFAGTAYGSPGPQSTFNKSIQDDALLERALISARHVLHGEGDVADRIDDVLTRADLALPGLKEALITKLLAVHDPERWLPSYVSTGPKGKGRAIELLGLAQPDPALTPGQRVVATNDVLNEALAPHLGDDGWAKQAFCFWLVKRDPSADPAPPDLAGLARRLYVDEGFLTRTLRLLRDRHQIVFYGPPGTGKTYVARELADHVAGTGEVVKVQFHPSYAYEDFVEGYRPTLVDGSATFELVDGPLKQLAVIAEERPDENPVLLIDEINRGNVAKILGELFFLLEYRDEEMRLQYSAAPFRLPDNLLMIATMNTADRSIALVDAALRRRFHFVAFFPDAPPVEGLLRRWLADHRPEMSWVADLVDRANEMLDSRHLAIGPSHFLRDDLDDEWLDLVWEHSVLPYLAEQFFGDEDRLVPFGLKRLKSEMAATASAENSGDGGTSAVDADLGSDPTDG